MGKSASRGQSKNTALLALIIAALYLALTTPLYIDRQLFFPFVTGRAFLFQALTMVAFAGWLILAMLEPKYRPRRSPVLTMFLALLGVGFLSSLTAYDRTLAFLGNFERMEGLVFLLHLWAYFLVAASVFQTERAWRWFLSASIGIAMASVLMTYSDFVTSGGTRFQGPVGNPTYMAIYMLFHVGLALLLATKIDKPVLRATYLGAAAIFFVAMIQSGTRGTAIGFAAGTVVGLGYFALRSLKDPKVRRVALGITAAVMAGAGLFFLFRNSDFVQGNVALSRIANINLGRDLESRLIVWSIAWDAFRDRPILGWGLGGFAYAFGQHFDPRMIFTGEPWFDRAHNIVFEWLIFAGLLGGLAYLLLLSAVGYSAIRKPRDRQTGSFSVVEQSLLLFIVVGYFVHNLVVFDVLVSYLMLVIVLAFVHQRVGVAWPRLENFKIPTPQISNFYGPGVVVAALAGAYFVNVPHRTAARDLASTAIYAGNPVLELEAYTAALSHGSIDRPFMVLLLLNRTTSVVQDPEILPTVKEAFLARAEEGLAFVRSEHAGDARIYFGAANMYGALGRLDEAQMYADLARSRAPTHPHMIRLQATLASQRGDLSLANEYLKDEYLVDVTRYDARRDYYTHLVEIGRAPEAEALLLEADDDFLRQYAVDDLRVGLLRNAQAFAALARLYEFRVEARPEALDEWANLSAYYQAMGQIEPAAAALERAGEAIPGLAPTLNCWAQNVRAGRPREEGC